MLIDGGTCQYTPRCMIHTGERRVPPPRHGTHGMNYTTILTDLDVHEIRKLVDANVRRRDIAKRFGVSVGTIQDIGRRRTWKWVT